MFSDPHEGTQWPRSSLDNSVERSGQTFTPAPQVPKHVQLPWPAPHAPRSCYQAVLWSVTILYSGLCLSSEAPHPCPAFQIHPLVCSAPNSLGGRGWPPSPHRLLWQQKVLCVSHGPEEEPRGETKESGVHLTFSCSICIVNIKGLYFFFFLPWEISFRNIILASQAGREEIFLSPDPSTSMRTSPSSPSPAPPPKLEI